MYFAKYLIICPQAQRSARIGLYRWIGPSLDPTSGAIHGGVPHQPSVMGEVKVDDEQSWRHSRLLFGINDYVPGFEVTVCNVLLMQKGHAFNELKAKGHNVVRTVTELQDLMKGRFPGQHDDWFANTEVDDFKQWDSMIRWRLDTAKLLQQSKLVGVINYLEDDRNAVSRGRLMHRGFKLS
jgi:hypothetical protein